MLLVRLIVTEPESTLDRVRIFDELITFLQAVHVHICHVGGSANPSRKRLKQKGCNVQFCCILTILILRYIKTSLQGYDGFLIHCTL